MNSYQVQSNTRREYRLSGWSRAFIFIVGCMFAAFSCGFGFLARSNPNGVAGILMALLFLAIPVYLVAYAVRSRIIVDGSRITVRTAFGEKSADRGEIIGFRTLRSRNRTYKQLYLRDGRSPIAISQSFSTDDDFRAWFAQIPDLDERDKQKLLDQISNDQELGATPEERLAALATAKTINVFTIIVEASAAAALIWAPAPFRLAAAIVLALAPPFAIFMVQRSPLLYALFKPKADPRVDLAFLILISGFGLAFSSTGVHFVSTQSILEIAGSIAAVLTAALYLTARNSFTVPGTVIAFLVVSGFYGYGLTSVADTLADPSTPQPYAAQVVGKHISRGRSTSYYLDLAPWGPIQTPNRLSVPSAIYRKTVQGDQVCLELHPGTLHVEWYRRVDCSYQPDWIAPQ